jgi:Ca2+-binding RTX toxin-like protein
VASQPHPSAGRAPRANLDSLAIGAPLTAALIGVLLTEGEGALGNAAAGASVAGGGAARQGDGEAGLGWHHEAAGARLGAATPSGLAGESAASTSGEILDPIAAGETTAPTAATGGGADGTLMPPEASPAALTGTAAPAIGMSITLGFGGPFDELGLDGNSVADADGAQPSHRIGVVIVGTAGDDVIHGTPFNDSLSGGPGNDTIFGYEGDDLLDGGDGHDQLFGGPGDDRLLGGNGNDGLFGGTGDDALLGGAGNDHLSGEAGLDRLDGDAGDDVLDGGADADYQTLTGSGWGMTGGTGNDRLVVDHLHDVALEYARAGRRRQ